MPNWWGAVGRAEPPEMAELQKRYQGRIQFCISDYDIQKGKPCRFAPQELADWKQKGVVGFKFYPGWQRGIGALRYRRFDVVLVQVLDQVYGAELNIGGKFVYGYNVDILGVVVERGGARLPLTIAAGTSQYGMQTFDQSIFQLYKKELITYEEALRRASNPDEFKLKKIPEGNRKSIEGSKSDEDKIVNPGEVNIQPPTM